jgi:ABC-type transport system substrate-binding protein
VPDIFISIFSVDSLPLFFRRHQHCRPADRLTICISYPIVSFDPTNYRNRETQVVLKNIFDSLTTRGPDSKVVPQLAESWQALDDLTWEFKLRRGVKFHNGDRFSARDVKFTLERVFKEGALDGKTSPRKSLLGPISAVDIIDDYTVLIRTEKPWAILPLMLTLQEIVPQDYMAAVGIQKFIKQPVGILVPKFKSRGRGNFSGYHNEKLDHLFFLAENTLNPNKRADYFRQAQELIFQDAPMIFGYAAREFYAVRERVQNFMPNSSGMLNMHDVFIEDGD